MLTGVDAKVLQAAHIPLPGVCGEVTRRFIVPNLWGLDLGDGAVLG